MDHQSLHIAILFFSRSAEAESDAKVLSPDSSQQKSRQLARKFIDHTHRQIIKSGLPYFIIDESRQQGSSFGERFTNAFLSIFQRGYKYVIAVGNDTPQLQPRHLKKTARELVSGKADIILGPAIDGGTWLTAYSKKAFQWHRFQNQPWETSDLFSSILANNEEQANILILEYFADIDDASDLAHFICYHQYQFQQFVRLIFSILVVILLYIQIRTKISSSLSTFDTYLLRAPPQE